MKYVRNWQAGKSWQDPRNCASQSIVDCQRKVQEEEWRRNQNTEDASRFILLQNQLPVLLVVHSQWLRMKMFFFLIVLQCEKAPAKTVMVILPISLFPEWIVNYGGFNNV